MMMMMMMKKKKTMMIALLSAASATAWAQQSVADSVAQHTCVNSTLRTIGSRLSVGGYGEINFSRNFYSDHVSRYSQPEAHKDDPSHGRFSTAATAWLMRRKTRKAASGNKK